MTRNEIVKSYREAKYKREQIKILSDLTCKPVKDIEAILLAAGETLPAKRTTKTKKAEVAEEPKKKEEPKKAKEIKVERNEAGLITVAESSEGNKFFDALEKDIEAEAIDSRPKKIKDLPDHVKYALTNELRRLDAQMEEIQKKKAEIINFMVDKDSTNE